MSDTNGMDVMKPLAPSTKVTCPVFANASNALLVAFPVAVATPAVVWMVSVTSFLEVLVVVFPMVVTDCPPTLIVSLVILPEVYQQLGWYPLPTGRRHWMSCGQLFCNLLKTQTKAPPRRLARCLRQHAYSISNWFHSPLGSGSLPGLLAICGHLYQHM